jgi:hypothetical protein
MSIGDFIVSQDWSFRGRLYMLDRWGGFSRSDRGATVLIVKGDKE